MMRGRGLAFWSLGLLALGALVLGGCRGSVKRDAPIHLNWNMDQQKRFDAQEPAVIVSQPDIFSTVEDTLEGNEEEVDAIAAIFTDGRSARTYVEGTVRADNPHKAENPCTLSFDDPHLCEGKVEGEFADTLPMELSLALLERGKDRFEIFCTPCHDAGGTGNSKIKETGRWPSDWPPPPSFHDNRLRKMPVGQIYDIVRNGVRNMPAYGKQVPFNDRWAIAAYVRTLQNSYNADLSEVPEDVAKAKGWE
jgi:cytochrome c5